MVTARPYRGKPSHRRGSGPLCRAAGRRKPEVPAAVGRPVRHRLSRQRLSRGPCLVVASERRKRGRFFQCWPNAAKSGGDSVVVWSDKANHGALRLNDMQLDLRPYVRRLTSSRDGRTPACICLHSSRNDLCLRLQSQEKSGQGEEGFPSTTRDSNPRSSL